MSKTQKSSARALADLHAGSILASVDIAVPPERVFRALTTDETTQWWGSAETYRTTAWQADVRVGGSYTATGVGSDGRPFSVRGEYLEVDPPRRLVQTWEPDWERGQKTKVTYLLDATPGGTRLTLRHEGFGDRTDANLQHTIGWEMVLGWLEAHVSGATDSPKKYFVVKLIPPRPTFVMDMSESERATMTAHVGYWSGLAKSGHAVVFGPVADPKGPHGIGIICARDEGELGELLAKDPAVLADHGLRHEVAPMLQAIVRD